MDTTSTTTCRVAIPHQVAQCLLQPPINHTHQLRNSTLLATVHQPLHASRVACHAVARCLCPPPKPLHGCKRAVAEEQQADIKLHKQGSAITCHASDTIVIQVLNFAKFVTHAQLPYRTRHRTAVQHTSTKVQIKQVLQCCTVPPVFG